MTRFAAISLTAATFALAGCRKSPTGVSSSFPAPGAVTIKPGDFITSTGVYESIGHPSLPDQIIDLRLSISPSGKTVEMKFNYETRRSAGSSTVYGGGDRDGPIMDFKPGWFCFVEKTGTYWTFDGRNSLRVDTQAPLAGPSKSIIQGTYVNRDNPRIPDAVLARIPAKQRDLLSPPSKEHPSF